MSLPEEENVSESFDVDAAVDDISSSLFGQDEDGEKSSEEEEAGEDGSASDIEAPPQTEVQVPEETENTEEVQALGAPGTWTKEGISEWAKIPPRAQQEILKREEDMLRGIEEYKGKAELGTKYDAVVEPYRAQLAASQVDPIQLFQSFAGNHYLLTFGTPQQKLQLGANLVKSYGLDLDGIREMLGNDVPVQKSPEIQTLEAKIAQLEGGFYQTQERERQALFSRFETEVKDFASDPKNIYYDKVSSDMATLISSGLVPEGPDRLARAYEKAVYQNPETRQLEIDRLASERMAAAQTEERTRLAAAEKAKGANVNTSPKTRDGTVPVGSIDDTLNETMSQIAARG